MHLDITKKRYIYIYIYTYLLYLLYTVQDIHLEHIWENRISMFCRGNVYIYIHARDHNEYCIFWTLRVPIKPGINNQFLAHHGFISLCGHNCPITRK